MVIVDYKKYLCPDMKQMGRLFCATALALCFLVLTGAKRPVGHDSQEASDPAYSLVGHTFAGFPVGLALCSNGDRQYVGFYDEDRRMTVAQRTLPDGPWKYVRLDSRIGWDSHNYITMKVDSRGALHVSGNMHVQDLVYFCTDETGEIETLHRLDSLVGDRETRMTYPSFIMLPDKRLIFHYRYGKSGNGEEIYDICDREGRWSRYLDTPLTDGKGLMNAYMSTPRLGSDKFYHMVWVWRNSPDCATNHDLCYAKSPDLKHWFTAAGEALELPISIDEKRVLVDPVPCGGGMLNGGPCVGLDGLKRPVISYFKYDEGGNTQVYVARYEDGGWRTAKVSGFRNFRWELHGGGSIVRRFWVFTPQFDSKGHLSVGYRRYDPGTEKRTERRIIIDGDSLRPICEKPVRDRTLPSWFNELQSDFAPDMLVKQASDSGGTRFGVYRLRWECLPQNRDREVKRPIPEPSEVRVVKIR